MKKWGKWVILLVVAALAVWAIMLNNKGGNGSHMAEEALSDFAVADTANIDKLILTDTEGNEGVTLVRNGATWSMDNGECVQQHLVHTILETIKHIKVKSPVPKNGMETVNKNLTTHHRKVEIYVKGELAKTWYVGQPTPDQYGTYMLLKDPVKGKSPEPFIMHLPTMYGNLETRFITNPNDFQCTGIFNYEPLDIKTIDVVTPDTASLSFRITILEDNLFDLSSNGKPVPDFDTIKVRNYILGYRKIHFEQHNYLINKKSEDSLKMTKPWFDITVTDVKGQKNRVLCYKKKMVYEKYDFDGKLIEFDRDRLWIVLNDGRLVVGQFYVFDKLLKDVRYFSRDPQVM
ncbi:MAG: hypothetical protein R2780_01500 [Crocinitomicaceae bacterium]|nr:hypothetical protein [Crocinitomicaceae bacterium]